MKKSNRKVIENGKKLLTKMMFSGKKFVTLGVIS